MRRQRWRCLLCGAFGYGRTLQERQDAFERHWAQRHLGMKLPDEYPGDTGDMGVA